MEDRTREPMRPRSGIRRHKSRPQSPARRDAKRDDKRRSRALRTVNRRP